MRGKKNIKDLGKIIELNGKEVQDVWFDDECNNVYGTDGTIFPPFMNKEDVVQVFVAQLCRSFAATYKHPSKVSGIKTSHYEVNVTAPADCYCNEEARNCPALGQFDVMPCIGVPITVTLPHFHGGEFLNYCHYFLKKNYLKCSLHFSIADPSLMDYFKGGIHPIPEKHSFYFDFYNVRCLSFQNTKRI